MSGAGFDPRSEYPPCALKYPFRIRGIHAGPTSMPLLGKGYEAEGDGAASEVGSRRVMECRGAPVSSALGNRESMTTCEQRSECAILPSAAHSRHAKLRSAIV
jgi:hypothetical protein